MSITQSSPKGGSCAHKICPRIECIFTQMLLDIRVWLHTHVYLATIALPLIQVISLTAHRAWFQAYTNYPITPSESELADDWMILGLSLSGATKAPWYIKYSPCSLLAACLSVIKGYLGSTPHSGRSCFICSKFILSFSRKSL